LQWFTEKYGNENGLIKYKEKNKNLSVSVDALKRTGHSETEIKEIRAKHSKKSRNCLEEFINRYGEYEGEHKYQEYIQKNHKTHFSKQFWIDKGFSETEARKKISKIQTRDLNWFVKKYGIDNGSKRYEKCNKLKIWKSGNVSKLENKIKDILDNHKIEFEQTKRILTYFVDFFIEKSNLIIEVFGDYWHCNPRTWRSDYFNKSLKMTAEEKWQSDQQRIQKLIEKGYNVVVIWEDKICNNTSKELYENYIATEIK